MTTNPNEIYRFEATPEMLDKLFERSNEQAMADGKARQRAAEWPSRVNQVLTALAKRSQSQDEVLAAIAERLSVLEAKLGIANG